MNCYRLLDAGFWFLFKKFHPKVKRTEPQQSFYQEKKETDPAQAS